MKAIVLVAGMGTRLKPFTDTMPKCLTEVNGKPILINMLEHLDSVGVTETTLVIGYLGNKIKDRIGEKFGNMKISYVENKIYDQTNTSYSLWLAIENLEFDNSLLILEGDVFFEQQLLHKFIKNSQSVSTIVEKYNPKLDGSFVELKDNLIIDWVHKKVRPANYTIEDKFKTVNIHKFDNQFFEQTFKPTLKQHVEEYKGAEPMEHVMQDIVTKQGGKIIPFEVGSLKWFEIDDADELKIAEQIFKTKPTLDEIKSLHGGYWRYDTMDFHYLVNYHFPTKEMIEDLKDKLPVLIDSYPSTQRVIAKAIAKWKDKPYFNEDNLIVTNGSSEAIRFMNNLITKIIVPIPTFNEYTQLPDEKIHYFLLDEKNQFKLDIGKFVDEIKESKSEFAVINNPNNPVGNVVPRNDIIKLLDTGVKLIVDEAFIDFDVGESVEDLVEKYDNLIIIKTVTKTMGLAGLRLGYVLTTNTTIKEGIKKQLPIWNINSLSEHFIDIFPKYEKDYWKSIEQTKIAKEELFAKLKQIPFLEPYETKSNFIFCKTSISSKKIAETLYDEHNILIRSELNQKMLKSDNYIRIGIRTKEDNDKIISILEQMSVQENFKILLIHANSTLDTLIPPNLAIMSTVLKQEGNDVKLFDTTFYKTRKITGDEIRVKTLQVKETNFEDLGIFLEKGDMYDDFIKVIKEYGPDLIGLSAVSLTYPFGIEFLRRLRKEGLKTPTIVGGTHATVDPEGVLKEDSVDYVCVGEGEYALTDLCDALKNNKSTMEIKNIWQMKDGELHKTELRPPVNMDTIPFQDWDMFDKRRIFKPMAGKIRRVGCFELDRGCPYSCTYCCNNFFNKMYNFKNYRQRDVKRFIEEVKHMKEKYGLEYVYLASESFLSSKEERFMEFIDLWKKEINLPFWGETRPETVTAKRIKLLKEAGLNSISIGVESGSPEVRKALNRFMTNTQIEDAFKILVESGVRVCANNIIGFPDETRENIFETIELNRKINATNIMIHVFNPYKKTPIYDLCVKKGYIPESEIGGDYRQDFALKMPQMSKDELLGLQRTFALYVKFPKELWPEIKIAEKDDKKFEELSATYKEKYL